MEGDLLHIDFNTLGDAGVGRTTGLSQGTWCRFLYLSRLFVRTRVPSLDS